MEIKAIETIYNGRRYRSRLEARWAVFFDSLGIRFEYEPEGFVLSNGMAYLPDFFLPDIGGGIFAEACALTVTNCTFTGNTATQNGGGVYVANNSDKVTIKNCTFEEGEENEE